MPIYEFLCQRCGHQFEKLVRVDHTAPCPACQSEEVERLLSLAAISTQKSRTHAITGARRVAMDVKKEKDHAQAEYERNYIRDHS